MAHRYTQEELLLIISDEVQNDETITGDELKRILFGDDISTISLQLSSLIHKEVFKKHKFLCRFLLKNQLLSNLKAGSAKFIKKFLEFRKKNEIIEAFNDSPKLYTRLKFLENQNSLGSLMIECSRIFDRLREKFASSENETKLRIFLLAWFRSSFMSLEIYEKFQTFNLSNLSLAEFKKLLESIKNDVNAKKILKMANSIKTDNFVEPQKLKAILEVFQTNPTLELENETLKVKGHLIFLSKIKAKIETFSKDSLKHVCIFAEDACIIDCNLDSNFWKGMHFSINTNKINVNGNHDIILSGKSYEPGNVKAKNSCDTRYNGEKGSDGAAGESSGTITLLAKEFFNPNNLICKLNGGRGKDGDDGGDGCDGANGSGVSQNEIENLLPYYTSLYRNSWSRFHDFSPPSNWKKLEGNSSGGEYILQKYKDENGRVMTYSFAGDKGWTYTTYELYFVIEGSNGSSGSSGGSNGVGGEGGYRGTSNIFNPETGESFNVNVIRNVGQCGKNGTIGKSGKIGINGNDLAIIDRSASEASKFFQGNTESKLSYSYVYEAEKFSRLNGYLRYVSNRKGCFIKFGVGERINTSERRAEKATERTTRERHSKAVAKSTVFIDEIIDEASEIFGKDNAFLADACEDASESVKDNTEEEEEEEEMSENISEEVNVLREKDATPKISKYTPDNEKIKRSTYTAEEFVKYVKTLGRQTSCGKNSQFMFDLFTIELNPVQMNAIALSTLFHQSHFREALKSPFTQTLIAALQSRLVDGKTWEEIKEFSKDFEQRRLKKKNTTHFRKELENFVVNFDASPTKPDMNIKIEDKIQFGIKACTISKTLQKYTKLEEIEKITEDFFGDYVNCKVDDEMLNEMVKFLKKIEKNPNYLEMIALFEKKDLKWTNQKATEEYVDSFAGWHKEEKDLKNSDKTEEKKSNSMRPKTETEEKFQHFLDCIVKDHEWWNELAKPLVSTISKNKEYTARFGEPPTLDEEGMKAAAKAKLNLLTNWIQSKHITSKDIALAAYSIKIYFLSKEILTFQKQLYNFNLVMDMEKKDKLNEIKLIEDFQDLIAARKQYPLATETADCQEYMQKHGLLCSAFRHLLSDTLNIRICCYKQKSFQTLELFEDLNSQAKNYEILWLLNGQIVGIAADKNFRDLITAQQSFLEKYQNMLQNELSAYHKNSFTESSEIQKLVNFYPAPLQHSVTQWIENYLALTANDTLISLLYNRFYVDGCHISVFELQYILSSISRLHKIFHCPINYCLLLLSSVSQEEFVDVIGYTRIQYLQGCRFEHPSHKIFSGFCLIPSTKYKALLTTKLDEYNKVVSEEDLYKVILTLQHASNGSEQLFKNDMSAWIEIAQKQKWNEVTSLLKKYGSIGYYLGVLNNYEMYGEEKLMQTIFDETVVIPEKLIAWYTNLIINEGIKKEEASDDLKKFLQRGDDFPELKDNNGIKPQLITDEIGQSRLMQWIKHKKLTDDPFSMIEFATENDRSIEDLAEKISGLKDNADERKKRAKELEKIAKILKSMDKKNENIKYLSMFDDALYKYTNKKIRLRNTQKMAILCAVESEKNVLEQVNTGEGKSYIIAAMAAIRCKTGHRFVDIITSSPVLAQRDAESMKPLYSLMGLTVGDNCSEDIEERKKAYSCDIVYGDIARFQRDYLLHTFYKKPILGDRFRDAVIVDEVDNMILDNSNNMLYLSHSVPGMNLLDSLLIFIQQQVFSPIYSGDKSKIEDLQEKFDNSAIEQNILEDLCGHFSLADLTKIVRGQLNKQKIQDIYDKLIADKIIDSRGYLCIHRKDQIGKIENALTFFPKDIVIKIQTCFQIIFCRERRIELPAYLRPFAKLHLNTLIENCKHAFFLEANTGYVIDVDRTGKLQSCLEPIVTIIDSNTGADLASSQWTGGLHQFLQLKHGCRVSPMSLKAVFMSNVSYLKDYIRMNGLSGTLGSAEESQTLIDIYGVDLIKLPTNKPKIFYEHVPVIATRKNEWIKNIFDEICDQVIVQRSVLVICEDIQQLNTIVDEIKILFQKKKNPHPFILECFAKMTIYKREHDEFNFEDEKTAFQTSQLIIATNLAGRGTDIKLSKNLINTGGLHVITAFMPKNRRIEEQAFGRAARCGQPGSAQIIALAEPVENSIEPSIFQLKTYRDNAEVHRLQSLKNFYDFHTDIEEQCLNKFRQYCEKVLAIAYSSSSTSSSKNDETLPSINQVIYFTLLDLWALWLDAKSPEIAQCSKEGSKEAKEQRKQEIIDSVDVFLKEHPYENFESAKKWIKNPQALLTIGIIQMYHNNGFAAADETFNSILAEGHEFGAEAEYYKGCMRMKGFTSMRDKTNELAISNPKVFETNIESAIEHFTKSRTLFQNQLLRKQKEAGIIAKLIEKAPNKNPKTSGFATQIKLAAKNIGLIISNIDNLLGNPCNEEMFVNERIGERYSKQIYDAMFRQGIIGPELLCEYQLEEWQIRPFKSKYKFQKNQLNDLVDSLSNDSRTQSFDDKIVLDKWQIFEKAELSSRGEFWAEMEQQKAFFDTELFIAVYDKSKLSKNLCAKIFDELKPYDISSEDLRFKVKYSSDKQMGILYKSKAVNDLIGEDEELKDEMQKEIMSGNIKLEKLANILITNESLSFFTNFDGILIDDFKEFFNLDNNGARWILNTLRESGCLEMQKVRMTRFTTDKETWRKLVQIHLPAEAKAPEEKDGIQKIMLFKNAGILKELKNNKKILNLTIEVIEQFCDLKDEKKTDQEETVDNNDNTDNSAPKFYNYLMEQKILEPYIYENFRINSKLDCSPLPQCISQKVDEFLSDRFAYSFALEDLCSSIEATYEHPNSQPHQIFLPENPFSDIFEDFIESGLGVPKRITTNIKELEYFDFEDFENSEEIKEIIYTKRPKLADQTHYHFEMVPFATYAINQNFQIDSDLRAIMDNGLKVVVARREEKGSMWVVKQIMAAASFCWNKIKSAASACANFGYSVVKFCCQLPGKIFDKVSEAVGPYVKEAGDFIIKLAKPLMDTPLGRAALAVGEAGKEVLDACKEVAIDCAYAALDAAEATIKYTKKAGKYVYEKAGEAVEWVGNTKIGQDVGEIFKVGITVAGKAINWVKTTEIWKSAAEKATSLFTKMSEFCTAASESYQYYNQCRTMSRQLVLQNHQMIDEHSILITFNGITKEETKKKKEENQNVKKIEKYIIDHRPIILDKIYSLIKATIKEHKEIDPLTLKKLITKSFAIKKFISELDILHKFLAWQKQIECYNILRNTNDEKDLNICTPSFASLESDQLYFLKDSIDEIFEEAEKLNDDEGYDSDTTEMSVEKDPDSLQEILFKFSESSVQTHFIDPTISLVLSYYCSAIDEELSPSASDAYFSQQDKSLKEALADYNQTNSLKQNSEFLSKELLKTIHQCFEEGVRHSTINGQLLKQTIKCGFPLPICVAPKIAESINRWLISSKIYTAGILLEVFDDKNPDLLLITKKFGDGKAKLKLRHINGQLFISQSDYHIYAKICDAGIDDSEKAFIYEGLIGYFKMFKQHFPKQGESLREILLQFI